MKLRAKLLIVMIFVWTSILILSYIGATTWLISSFKKLEDDQATANLTRISQALNQVNYSLGTFTTDWAHWNEVYNYYQGNNEGFVPNNLVLTAFINSTINAFMYFDKEEKLLVGGALDIFNKKYIPFPSLLKNYLTSHTFKSVGLNKTLTGYLLINQGISMFAASAISDSQATAPSLGTLVTLRFVTPKIIKQIENIIKLPIKIYLEKDILKNPELNKMYKDLKTDSDGKLSHIEDNNLLKSYLLLRDINNEPIAMIETEIPRLIYLNGKITIQYFLITFFIFAVLISLLMWWFLKKIILKRLENLNHKVVSISKNKEFSIQLVDKGSDELSSLTLEINNMLKIINRSQMQLEQRVKDRTTELHDSKIQLSREINEKKEIEHKLIKNEETLIQLAHFDTITSLPNRMLFNEILNKAILRAKKHNTKLAIFFIDLDRFKTINDAFGHTVGDKVLQEVAKRFSEIFNKNKVARLGGDEFILLREDTNKEDTIQIADNILGLFAAPIIIDTHEFYLNTSIGICFFPGDGESLEDLQKNADMALYKAKQQGGGNYQFFTEEMFEKAHEFIQIDTGIRKALENDEFEVFYQPKLSLKTGKMLGAEALLRWNHPQHGLIFPSKFIQQAEQTGLIIPIGEWVLRQACLTNKKWQNEGFEPISVAVNLSPKQFHHAYIVEDIAEILKETELLPEYLELEITESAVVEDMEKVKEKLHEIHQLGVKISIDDFGTGYTSINYLKEFPVNYLKIDQSFIKGLPDNNNDVSIIEAIMMLAHELNIEIIAEGVETNEQLEWLEQHQCEVIQGYFYSRPLPMKKMVFYLDKNQK